MPHINGIKVTEGFEYQIVNTECVRLTRVQSPDGTTREVKVTFANGAVLRMTEADDPDRPRWGDTSATPFVA